MGVNSGPDGLFQSVLMQCNHNGSNDIKDIIDAEPGQAAGGSLKQRHGMGFFTAYKGAHNVVIGFQSSPVSEFLQDHQISFSTFSFILLLFFAFRNGQ
jgi:hypothetical protein